MLATLFLFVACVVLCMQSAVAGPQAKKLTVNNKVDRLWRGTKTACEKNECSKFVPEEAYNCVNKCLSPDCYEEVYATNPLEDGEIDITRSRAFTGCVRQEVKKGQGKSRVKD